MALIMIALIALSVSGISSAATAPRIQNVTRPLSDMPRILDLNHVVKSVPSIAVKRRGVNNKQLPQDDIECLEPSSYYGPPSVEGCNNLCNNFLANPTNPVTIQPLQIINWYDENCEFGLANIDPCEPVTIQEGYLVLWCQDMLAQCVVGSQVNGFYDQLDGYYDLSSYHLAAALTADEAAPPYSEGSC